MQNNNIKISIIVPVYNVEKYLSRCLDSLVNQTYKNIEIICVNDGSSDNSLQVLNEYASKDNRIKVINQENLGVSTARNVGIDNVTGEYMMFVDSDDWLELNACEIIYRHMNNVDILFFNVAKVTNKKKTIRKDCGNLNEVSCSFFDKVQELFEILDLRSVWGKVYNRNLVNNIHFKQKLSFGEDTLFLIEYINQNPKIKIINNLLYNYFDTPKSLSKVSSINQLNQMKILLEYFKAMEFNNKELGLWVYYDTFLVILGLWDLYFTEYKKDFLAQLVFIEEFAQNIDKQKLKQFKKLLHLPFYNFLIKVHGVFLYRKIIRPIGKYCIVLPYRRVKNFLRRGK